MSTYVPAFPLSDLAPGTARLFKHGRERIAVFHTESGAVRAVDDRCPHQGYPLTQGVLKGDTLTCAFHNYKFDLCSGACLLGDEDVATWPVRVEGGLVEVDVTQKPLEVERQKHEASLRIALREERTGQLAREAARLLDLGATPREIALIAARYDAEHAEYGTTHALPMANDLLSWMADFPGLAGARPFTELLALVARSHVRRPPRATPAPVDPGDPSTFDARLHDAVENERVEESEALVRGALAAGWGKDVLEPAFLTLCADHFLDYGHALIYVLKAFDLDAPELLPALAYSIALGTREDTLPAWAGFRATVAAVEPHLGELDLGGTIPADLAATLADSDARTAVAAVVAALGSGADRHALADALVRAAAVRLFRYDETIDSDPTIDDDWLSATHVLTFCHAVRIALRRDRRPRALLLLLQAARFVGATKTLDAPSDRWLDPTPRGAASLDRLQSTLAAHDPAEAVRAVAAWLSDQRDLGPLLSVVRAFVVDHGASRPIVVAHQVKVLTAAEAEWRENGDPMALLSAIRFIATRLPEREQSRNAHEAIALVADGRIPRRRVH